jgi:hypothetical protein
MLLAFLSLKLLPVLLSAVAEEYYEPVFVTDATRNIFYYVHPVVIVVAFALALFGNGFKSVLNGNWFTQRVEMGLIYLIMPTLPAILIIYSAIDVPVTTISTGYCIVLYRELLPEIFLYGCMPDSLYT